MVLAAVGFPILGLFYVHALHRRRDVGTLAAIGFTQLDIFVAFLLEAALVAVIGVTLGTLLGALWLIWFAANPIFEWEGFVIVPFATTGTYLRPAAVVAAATLVAAALPAWLAARTDPARVLRGSE
jgi:putative ABC transport system permease protein